MRVTRAERRTAGWVLLLASLAVVVWVAGTAAGPDMDRRSYQKGYGAFAGAYLPPSDDERQVDELYCERFWGKFPSNELTGVVKDDWVQGCADYLEGKPSQFD